VTGHRLEQVQRRVRAHRRGQERFPDVRRQHAHSLVDQIPKVVRNGKGAAEVDTSALALERPSDLERVERVSTRRLMDLPQQRPAECLSEHRAKQLEQRPQAERAHRDRLVPSRQRLGQRRALPTCASAPDGRRCP